MNRPFQNAERSEGWNVVVAAVDISMFSIRTRRQANASCGVGNAETVVDG